ncbi:MAG: hypothetical protein J6Z46_08335 [Lachnospiraceae bacterium]|nr:hypothetical protein [Lachnospiraceae bacterium]
MKFTALNGMTAGIAGILTLMVIIRVLVHGKEKIYGPKALHITAVASWLASLFLMVVPLFVGKFYFRTLDEALVWFYSTFLLLVVYIGVYIAYYARKKTWKRIVVTAVNVIVFLMFGIAAGHIALIVTGTVFAVSIAIVTINREKAEKEV